MKRKVLIAAGGTGGHLLPAQQLAALLQEQGIEVVFAGYKLDRSPYFQREKFRFEEVASAPLREKGWVRACLRGVWQAVRVLFRERPCAVVGFGSYHAAPILLAAALLGKKLILYEPNLVMGKVNRLLAPFAKKIAVQFPGKRSKKFVPIPLFPWTCPKPVDPKTARRELGLEPEKQTILVFGGSQGASFFNEKIPAVASALGTVQIIHLAGSEEAAKLVRSLYAEQGISAVVKAFESNMPLAYSAADFAICRSGAGTMAELIRWSVPALLIPYPYAADDHQRHNAEFLSQLGGAMTLLQSHAAEKAIVKKIQAADWTSMKLALRLLEEQNRNRMEFAALVNSL